MIVNFMKACNFIKKETLAQVVSCELCKIAKSNSFTEHLLETAFKWFNEYYGIYFRTGPGNRA